MKEEHKTPRGKTHCSQTYLSCRPLLRSMDRRHILRSYWADIWDAVTLLRQRFKAVQRCLLVPIPCLPHHTCAPFHLAARHLHRPEGRTDVGWQRMAGGRHLPFAERSTGTLLCLRGCRTLPAFSRLNRLSAILLAMAVCQFRA